MTFAPRITSRLRRPGKGKKQVPPMHLHPKLTIATGQTPPHAFQQPEVSIKDQQAPPTVPMLVESINTHWSPFGHQ